MWKTRTIVRLVYQCNEYCMNAVLSQPEEPSAFLAIVHDPQLSPGECMYPYAMNYERVELIRDHSIWHVKRKGAHELKARTNGQPITPGLLDIPSRSGVAYSHEVCSNEFSFRQNI